MKSKFKVLKLCSVYGRDSKPGETLLMMAVDAAPFIAEGSLAPAGLAPIKAHAKPIKDEVKDDGKPVD